MEGDKTVWAYWEAEMAKHIDPDYFIFIDKSHVDQKTAQRKNGWAPVGFPPVE